jgi:PTS system mannose-specific IIB component
VHYALRRRPVTPSVFLDDEELSELRDLEQRGFDVEVRALPTDVALDPTRVEGRRHA